MQIKKIFNLDSENKYSIISKSFHWLRFLLLILIYYGAFSKAIDHRIFGVVFFIFIIFNIVWRLFNKMPKSHAKSNLEANIQSLVYGTMYTVLLFIPILGYLTTFKSINLGFIEIPSLYSFSGFADFLQNFFKLDVYGFRTLIKFIHKFLAYFLIFLITVHGIVIVFNRIVRKTDELKRMM